MKIDLNVRLPAETIFYLGTFPVTNSLIWQVAISIFLIIFFTLVARSWRKRPTKLQAAVEMLVENALNMLGDIISDHQSARRMFPFIFTIFLYILVSNLFPVLLPVNAFTVQSSITDYQVVPLIRAPFADYNKALLFTGVSVMMMQLGYIVVHGFRAYVGKFLSFKSPIAFALGIMEAIGEITKTLSLSLRLFGNIFAGEVLTTVILLIAPLIVPIPFTILGILTATIQALVFSLLSAVFLHQATTTEATENVQPAAEVSPAPQSSPSTSISGRPTGTSTRPVPVKYKNS